MKNLILILSIICLLCSCGVENNVVEFIIGNPPNNFYCFNVIYQTNLRKEDEKEFMEVLTETLRKEYIRISKDYIGVSEHTILRKFISNLDHYTFEFKGAIGVI